MPWQKMRFRGDRVWVSVDDGGRPILDGDGRAEMKYREADAKSYRPTPANLTPDSSPGPDTRSEAAARPHGGAASPTATAARRSPRAKSAGAGSGAASAGARARAGTGAAIEIWTDGACSGNPGPMGIGVVAIDGAHRQEVGEYLGIGTNNIAELVAIERGLDIVAARRVAAPDRPALIFSDSAYSIGVLSKGWKAKANQELIARIRRKLATLPQVELVKVAGHAGVPENERCDVLARTAITDRA